MSYSYTALGDSLTVGIGSFFRAGFVHNYATRLEKTFSTPVSLNIEAKVGLTSIELLEKLQDHKTRIQIAESDLITITIGGNDLIQALQFNEFRVLEQSIHQFAHNMARILTTIKIIKTLRPNRPYLVQLIGLYNPVPYLPFSDHFIRKYNNVLHSFTSPSISYVDIYLAFLNQEKRLLADDGHPNNHGYRIMTDQVYLDYLQAAASFKQ